MTIFKKIPIFIIVVILTFSFIPSVSFAVVDPATSAMVVSEMAQAFGMYYGVQSGFNNINSTQATEWFTENWGNYQEFTVNSANPAPDLSDVYDMIVESGSISSSEYKEIATPNNTNNLVFSYTPSAISLFSNFWDYMLSNIGEMVKVDNQYYEFQRSQEGTFAPIIADTFQTTAINDVDAFQLPLAVSSHTDEFYSAKYQFTKNNSNTVYFAQIEDPDNNTPGRGWFVFFSFDGSATINVSSQLYTTSTGIDSGNPNNLQVTLNIYSASGNNFWYGRLSQTQRYVNSIPIIPYNSTYINSLFTYYDIEANVIPDLTDLAGAITLKPTDENLDGVVSLPIPGEIVDALDLVIDQVYYPDVYGDVFPLPPGSIELIAEDVFPSVIEEEFELVEELVDPVPPDPEPSPPQEVFTPLLPITLPSFNFNFSGIWHYVRDWVSSIGAWFTLTFQIWASLPYAIVVPVYATAVVVIVLGVYRRFFM